MTGPDVLADVDAMLEWIEFGLGPERLKVIESRADMRNYRAQIIGLLNFKELDRVRIRGQIGRLDRLIIRGPQASRR